MQLAPPPPSPPLGNGTNSTNSTNTTSVANTTNTSGVSPPAPMFYPPPPGPVAWGRGISLNVTLRTTTLASAQMVQQLFVAAAENASVAATLTVQLIRHPAPNATIVLTASDVSAVEVVLPPPLPATKAEAARLSLLALLCLLLLLLLIILCCVTRGKALLLSRAPKTEVGFWAECELQLPDDGNASRYWVVAVYDAALRAASQKRPCLPRPVQLRVEAAMQRALGTTVGSHAVQLNQCTVMWSDDGGPRMMRVRGVATFCGLGSAESARANIRAAAFQGRLMDAQSMNGSCETPLSTAVSDAMEDDKRSRGVYSVRLWPVHVVREYDLSDGLELTQPGLLMPEGKARRVAMLQIAEEDQDHESARMQSILTLMGRRSTEKIDDTPISSPVQYALSASPRAENAAAVAIRALVGVREPAPVRSEEPERAAVAAIKALVGNREPRVSIFDSGSHQPRRKLRRLPPVEVSVAAFVARRSWHAAGNGGGGGLIPATPMDSSFTSETSYGDIERGEGGGRRGRSRSSSMGGRRRSAPAGERRSRSSGRDRSDSPMVRPAWK
jgi:hypothetical protein